jgi:aconitate hydratase
MIKLAENGAYVLRGKDIIIDDGNAETVVARKTGNRPNKDEARKGTMAYSIIAAHDSSREFDNLRLKFDSLTAHDITYVGIIQTARASGMDRFPLPFVMTNCHNSLCAVGGTINEDDHMFALSAARKYGGIYVPPNLSVIHSYNREMMTRCGAMILGSDSHTRYGALGTMAVGEGGGELAKQLLGRTYDLRRPQVVAVLLTGSPHPGVGPHDVALSIVAAVYKTGYVKNKVMEFIGDGIAALDIEYRNGIDVMTTETTCWSSIWITDDKVREYFAIHGRPQAYARLAPADVAYYDGLVEVDLGSIEPSIAMPFHPSNVFTIAEVKRDPLDILRMVKADAERQIEGPSLRFDIEDKVRGGELYVDQGIVAGCAGGTFDNVNAVADILDGQSVGHGVFSMNVYPASQPEFVELVENGSIGKLMRAGVIVRSAFCGPCFGAGDTPANQGFSIRHTTRNFPNREGSKPNEGQVSYVALMDARSIAATAINGGRLTAATDLETKPAPRRYVFHEEIYRKRVFDGTHAAEPEVDLAFGPNICDWPAIPALTSGLLLKIVTFITDPVTTTDELIPSGETSSYRSNPLRLAEFTLGRKDPAYVRKAKTVRDLEWARERGDDPSTLSEDLARAYAAIRRIEGFSGLDMANVGIGSAIYAQKPGDGSAREQAASCQRVLGAWANFAGEYATKRYRSNLINWGVLPFLVEGEPLFSGGDFVFVPDVRERLLAGASDFPAYSIGTSVESFLLKSGELSGEERRTLVAGCLINSYRAKG